MVEGKERPSGAPIYQLKATLKYIQPAIWRRFLAPADITIHRLHLILQEVMGWETYHLYRFQIGRRQYGEPHPDNDFDELDFKNSRRAKLGRLVKEQGANFLYEYDFGDSWIHELLLEEILEPQASRRYPVCLDGRRACPPEDCGGPGGYAEMLEALGDPDHEEHDTLMEWTGGAFDPEEFDLEEVNNWLRNMR